MTENLTYNGAGRTSTVSFPEFNYYPTGNSGGYVNTVNFQYGYAFGNRLTSLTQWASVSQGPSYGPVTLAQNAMFDAGGRLTSVDRPTGYFDGVGNAINDTVSRA